jgi:hypothetical protein
VERKEVSDITDLYPSFGQTGRALAGNRLTITETEYFRDSKENSGVVLTKTIKQLKKSITTHRHSQNLHEKQMLSSALEIAEHLKKGDKVSEGDLKATLQNIDGIIEKWNKEFENRGS